MQEELPGIGSIGDPSRGELMAGFTKDRITWWIEFHYEMNRRQVRRCVISLQTILEHYGRYVDEFVHLSD